MLPGAGVLIHHGSVGPRRVLYVDHVDVRQARIVQLADRDLIVVADDGWDGRTALRNEEGDQGAVPDRLTRVRRLLDDGPGRFRRVGVLLLGDLEALTPQQVLGGCLRLPLDVGHLDHLWPAGDEQLHQGPGRHDVPVRRAGIDHPALIDRGAWLLYDRGFQSG